MEEKGNVESALRSLEQAVERLESGELSLEESLECFEAGVK
ncbi:MAG: exodeoxyribonuclease VII small subunit, partial [Desulfuromonadales bacterium]